MKNKFFLSIGLFLGLIIHVLTTVKLYYSKVSDHAYFQTSMMATVLYFILTIIGFAILVIIPIELAKKMEERNHEQINWPWQSYLSCWVLLALVGLEYLMLNIFSLKIGERLFMHTMYFFIPKGLCLIPAYFIETKSKLKSAIGTLLFLELIAVIILATILWMAGQVVPDFG